MTTQETVTGARRALGSQLAALREAAGHTQTSLARRIGYSRSTIASVECGQNAARQFWEQCDEVLRTGGDLVAAFDEIEQVRRQRQEAAAAAAQAARQAQVREWQQERRAVQAPTDRTEATDPRDTAASGASTLLAGVLQTTLRSPVAAPATVGHQRGADGLERRVLTAHQQQGPHPEQLSVTLVGGFAGSGKSEFARFLSAATGWAILDKDTISRALAERLLVSLGCDPDDRHSEVYLSEVRQYEYRCLIDAAMENLAAGVSTVLTAPFVREFADQAWLQRFQNRCASHNAVLAVVWVACDVESMQDYIRFRAAGRDSWKLRNWDAYLATIDPDFRPDFPHYTVDNRLNAAVALAEQARSVALQVRHATV